MTWLGCDMTWLGCDMTWLSCGMTWLGCDMTWLSCEATNDIHINAVLPDGYTVHNCFRNSELGWRYHFNFQIELDLINHFFFKFEHMSCRVIIN